MEDVVFSVVAATLRTSAPLILAALAGLFSERSGIVDVGLEGKILLGAFAAAATAAVTGNVYAGLLAAVLSSLVFGLIHGFSAITLRGNQVVSGMAVNILASGLTAVLALSWFQQGGQTPPLPPAGRFLAIPFPGAEALHEVPFLGPVIGRLWGTVIGGQTLPVYIAFLAVPVSAWVLYRTRFGLRLRAAGENPAAVDTAGISVVRLRYAGVAIAAVLCGVAGAAISTAQGAGFVRDMVAGRGFIALAAMILGKWRPWPTLFTCLLFGVLDAVAIRMQGVVLPGIGEFPVQLVQALPYLLTVVLLAGFVGRSIPPKASGTPYVKER
ncbi:ABC transporter permease [Roseomonas elaeocarpi]|uniref:ABC transporter permease n=1 Tax=Roseomonas elaeocarpi TaxID=907779 RepID=A0ABV6JRM8_9PROT